MSQFPSKNHIADTFIIRKFRNLQTEIKEMLSGTVMTMSVTTSCFHESAESWTIYRQLKCDFHMKICSKLTEIALLEVGDIHYWLLLPLRPSIDKSGVRMGEQATCQCRITTFIYLSFASWPLNAWRLIRRDYQLAGWRKLRQWRYTSVKSLSGRSKQTKQNRHYSNDEDWYCTPSCTVTLGASCEVITRIYNRHHVALTEYEAVP